MEPVGGIRRYVLLEHRVYRASRAGQIEGSRGEHSWSHDVVQPDQCCAPLASVRCGHRVIDQSRLLPVADKVAESSASHRRDRQGG